MVPHQDTVRSRRFGRRSIPLTRAVVATLVLIATAVIGISSSALAHEHGDSATVSHTCRHTDGCHSNGQLHSQPRHQCDDAATAAGVPKPLGSFHPHHGDCHEHARGPVS